MNPFKIKFTVGLLAIVCGFPVSAQPPQAPATPRQAQQNPGEVGRAVPLGQQDLSNIPHIENLAVALKSRNELDPKPLSKKWQKRITEAAGVPLEYVRVGGGEWHIIKLPRLMTQTEAEEIAVRIRKLPEIQYADPVGGGEGFAVPTDPLYATKQWNLQSGAGGTNLPPAWDLTTGNNTLVVAVIDSGIIKTHPEFSGRLLTGYDFITDATRANDGGGRDAFPDDPGDWVTQAEVNGGGAFTGCSRQVRNSTWHGTGTAGVIGAAANNAQGIAGVDWNVKILPIRVLGKCVSGSSYSEDDLADAIRWAAGIAVSGVANPNPAKIINISLGGARACSSLMQSAIDAALKKGAVVVAAVGNTPGGSATANSPANCQRVIRVAATTRQGGLAPYSNQGEAASLSAPGGDFTSDPLDAIKSPSDGGLTTPLNNGSIGRYAGTSSAAPHVSGVASLMLSLRPKMAPQLVKHILLNTTRNFPIGTSFDCDNITCGTGILNAENAARVAKSKLAAGRYHTAALRADGSVVTWGSNGNGALGGGEASTVHRTSPGTPIAVLPNTADLAAGHYHNVAAKADGTVWAWGYNYFGQVGAGPSDFSDRATPVQVSGLTNVVAVAAGDLHTLALRGDGTVWAWGYNFSGQLGVGPFDFTDRATPVQVSGLTGVIAIVGGGKRSMALKNDGTVWAWGDTSNVSADGNSASVSSVPIQVAGLADIVAIAAGGESAVGTGVNLDVSMALTFDGKVYTWGYNSLGQLGIGNGLNKFLPQLVTSLLQPAVKISTGGYHAAALLEDGTLWTWGYNADGQLGDGTQTFRPLPVLISAGLSKTVDIVAGLTHTLAFAGDTSLRAWGSNFIGQLGDGTQTIRRAPVQVHGQGNTGFFYSGYTGSSSADLSVSMTDSPDPIAVGSNLTYSMLLLNGGSDAATNVQAVFALPSQTSFVSASAGCAFANATVTCNLGTLAGGGSASVQVTAQPTAAGTLNASVSVSSDLFDPSSANNVAAATTTVNAPVAVADDTDVPTLPEWGVILMGSLLLANMAWMQRRKYRR